jgi:hypothetical protein
MKLIARLNPQLQAPDARRKWRLIDALIAHERML